MIDNAVAHYDHLIAQEVPAERAIQHVRQRFGVSEDTLRERIAGKVAQHDATMDALSKARAYLIEAADERPGHFTDADAILWDLYEAVTGEDLDTAEPIVSVD